MNVFQESIVLMLNEVVIVIIIFLRISSMLFFIPVFGENTLSARGKVYLSFLFLIITFPQVAPEIKITNLDAQSVTKIFFTEIAIGTFFGLCLRMFVIAIQTAGSIAAQTTSLAQIFGVQGIDPLPAIGNMLTISAISLLTVMSFDTSAIQFLLLTYDIFPPLDIFNLPGVGKIGVGHISHVFELAFSLAAPFVIISMLYNLTLGVISRAMPQLMVAFVGAPLIILLSIGLLVLCAPAMLNVWHFAIESFMLNPFVHADV